MTPSRPYLVRAIHDWLVDNDLTPQIVVNADADSVEVPRGFVSEGQIVLNISHRAVRGLTMDNEAVSFSARFDGSSFDVVIPMRAVLAVIARENGVGMSFQNDDSDDDPPPDGNKDDKESRPKLRVVK